MRVDCVGVLEHALHSLPAALLANLAMIVAFVGASGVVLFALHAAVSGR
jgi:hypothetical protein